MILNVKVKPGSWKDLVVKEGGEYIVYTKARAEDGKANESVKKLLSREFGVSIKDVNIKTPKSRRKVVEILM